MYTITKADGRFFGIDNDGNRRMLLDGREVYRNKSAAPLHKLDVDENGDLQTVYLWEELLSARYEDLPVLFKNSYAGILRFALECLIVDHMMQYQGAKQVAAVDLEDEDADRLASLLTLFECGHKIRRMSSGDYSLYRNKGFSLVVIATNEKTPKTRSGWQEIL